MQDSDWEEEKREEEKNPADLMLNMSIKPFHVCVFFWVEKKRSLGAFLHQNYLQKQKSPRNFFEFGCMFYSNFSSEGVWALTTRLNLVESKLSLVCFFDKKIYVTWANAQSLVRKDGKKLKIQLYTVHKIKPIYPWSFL